MGEGAPSMSLGSSPATPNGTAHNHTCDHSRDPRPEPRKTQRHTYPAPKIQAKLANVDKAGEETGIFRGLAVEEIVDSI